MALGHEGRAGDVPATTTNAIAISCRVMFRSWLCQIRRHLSHHRGFELGSNGIRYRLQRFRCDALHSAALHVLLGLLRFSVVNAGLRRLPRNEQGRGLVKNMVARKYWSFLAISATGTTLRHREERRPELQRCMDQLDALSCQILFPRDQATGEHSVSAVLYGALAVMSCATTPDTAYRAQVLC